jgi:hypothetical protein
MIAWHGKTHARETSLGREKSLMALVCLPNTITRHHHTANNANEMAGWKWVARGKSPAILLEYKYGKTASSNTFEDCPPRSSHAHDSRHCWQLRHEHHGVRYQKDARDGDTPSEKTYTKPAALLWKDEDLAT